MEAIYVLIMEGLHVAAFFDATVMGCEAALEAVKLAPGQTAACASEETTFKLWGMS